ncbi:hypothetical protein OFR22_05050 [Brachyspira hyodysenteriae]|uniref:Uncharacterized protein n=2 Tax=Brachyspira hyodysenteriae TaxID=159 RepID=A0A3B6VL99_BRAHW|nr:hypothetical protein [Brachyspira hyodysenteriae]ACN84686.1 hypothetical protein BHWA1_02230 [Brachyspira hyodysenteriae WA1]ANN63244.1 hypothetical protein BHYOB78_05015 [Brachyspira hyodysenteriae ATCC 27164]AUJ50418.1 hypothetical protein BH718_01986 [Brachyspira hyodysenteriae]KLI16137.1 hypothetical protein SU45_09635 [Brachyspira hyodysenteriae]KLI16678.1 hypothetical protein SU44_04785 [Brachyspira hyodysenteriae]
MVSIKRQRQIKLFFILSIILIVIISLFIIFGYFPYGLHKKDMSEVKIPKDNIAYVSVKSLDKSILKFSDSIYAYRISHDESMYDFSILLRKAGAFADRLRTNDNFFIKMASKPMLRRNSALLFWGYNGNLDNSEIFYLFDIGRLNSFIFSSFFNSESLTIDNITYELKKVNYNGNKIYALDNGSPYFFFTFYKGLLIITKNYNHVKKLIDFLNSDASGIDEVELLNNVENKYESDISFYINKQLFDYNKCEGSLLFTPLQYFNNAYTIYGNAKINNDNGLMDIFVDYEYGGSERYSLYGLEGQIDIQNYLPKERTVMYFALKSYLAGLYPIMYNDLKMDHNNKLYSELYNLFTKMNDVYSFGSIINDLYGEMAVAYIESKRSELIYPVMIFNIENDAALLPKLEVALLEKYPNLIKKERNYNNRYIYSYDLNNGNMFYYTFVDKVYFVSENEKAIETIIDSVYDGESLDSYIKTQISKNINPDYVFTIQLSKSQDILRYFNIPLRTWSYPNSIIIGSTINSNYTHVNIDFKANFNSVSK